MLEERHIPSEYTERLMEVKQTESNIDIDNVLTVFPPENRELFIDSRTTIFPILGGGERLGTLVLGRVHDDFNENDLVLGEYAATVIGMEILREKHSEVEKRAIKLLLQWQLIHYLILKKKRLNISLKNLAVRKAY